MSSKSNNQQSLTNTTNPTKNVNTENNKILLETSKLGQRQNQILWHSVTIYFVMHVSAICGLYFIFVSAKLATTVFGFFTYNLAIFGTTAGAHRLWSHRAYKATWQLRCLLVFCQTLAYQHSIIQWARDHRTHHKYSETDADPHNAKRGFFFSHIGWLMCKKHPDVIESGKTIDISDLNEDPLLRFQHRYFMVLMPIVCFLVPTVLPMLLWKETFIAAFFVNIARYIVELHMTCTVNSIAHLWGSKPYDKYINPGENPIVSFFMNGEGWHNYHHAFPWDYKASEFGTLNLTSLFINFFAKIGWAYDLKTVSKEMIKSKVDAKGDGSHRIWGSGDKR